MFPKILLIGKIGQVGWELRRTLAPLGPLTCIDFPEIDLTDGGSIRKWVHDVSPQIIVNAAAYTAVDKAESEPGQTQAMKINGDAPGILAEEAKKLGALLVHYSTDYVFDGTKTEPYTEEDTPNPLNAYGRSKWAGDQAVQAVGGDYLIFRLCWVYGARGNNFMLTIMRLAKEREKLRVVADQFGCPTWSRMIAETTALALARSTSFAGISTAQPLNAASQHFNASTLNPQRGLYNLCATGSTSWHDFANKIVHLMPSDERKCREVQPITTPEYPTPAKRPAYSVLSNDKLARTFGLRLPGWEESLRLLNTGN